MMGWSDERITTYFQAALNLIPLVPSIPTAKPERFYTAVMETLPAAGLTKRVKDDEYQTLIALNSISRSTLAVYLDELRWTSAYLLHESVRPSNLKVISSATADRVIFEKEFLVSSNVASDDKGTSKQPRAVGVVLRVQNNNKDNKEEEKECLVLCEPTGEVVLTGGALGAVGVLQRSGIG